MPRQLPRVVPRRAVPHRQVGENEPRTEQGRRFSSSAPHFRRFLVGQHHIHPQLRRMIREHLQVRLRGEAVRLARLRGEVQHDDPAGPVAISASASPGTRMSAARW